MFLILNVNFKLWDINFLVNYKFLEFEISNFKDFFI